MILEMEKLLSKKMPSTSSVKYIYSTTINNINLGFILSDMSPKNSWTIVPLLTKLQTDPRLTSRAQTVAKLLALDLQKIRSEMEKAGNYWYALRLYKDEVYRRGQQELYQRTFDRMTAQMEILYDQMRRIRDQEVKTTLTTVVVKWNSLMELLVRQFPNIKDCQRAKICKKGELCWIGWEG